MLDCSFRKFTRSSLGIKVLPLLALILISGSEAFKKERLKVLRPENPAKTMDRARVPSTTPRTEIPAIILIALLELFEIR